MEMQIRSRGRVLPVYAWKPGETLAVVHIVHGMAEHGGRYAAFAERLVEAGFAVYAQDLPGHGRAIADGVAGHFADRNGWRVALEVIEAVHDNLHRYHPGRPVFLLGHSMGSFLAQHFMLEHSHTLAGVVLSSTSGDLGPLRRIGLAVLRAEIALYGPRHPSAIAEALSFKAFNHRFAPNRTDFDWLSRDADSVDRYIADPACRIRVTAALWRDLLAACGALRSPRRLRRIDPKLPVLMLAGGADPVSRGEAGPAALMRAYRRVGMEDVHLRTWSGARHELLHETCRESVVNHIRGWLRSRLAGRQRSEH